MSTGADRLSEEQKVAARAVAARMLLDEPSTAKEIIAAVRKKAGGAAGDPHRNFVDRWLQGLRRDGCVSHSRHGRLTYWSYTAGGRERLEASARHAS